MHKLRILAGLTRRQYRAIFGFSLTLACLTGLGGCTTYAHQQWLEQGLIRQQTVSGTPFQHVIFRPANPSQRSKRLHIYIEGDGLPFRTSTQIASNPTSPNARMLQAMLADPDPALLLGRPCYYEVADPLCSGRWWTSHRYSADLVASMTGTVEQLIAERETEPEDIWLIGHSGGGALAVLIGARLQRPVTVVTLAANLDIDAWTQHHGFSPLFGSLNPIRDNQRNPQMRELHWYGSSDQQILPEWPERYCAQRQAQCLHYDGNHTDWLTQWPTLLQQSQQYVDAQNSQRMPAE